ncbi:MAG: hypothetical protein HC839_04805 [Leptolyngbyaceae cyanobacterium RM2_2_21]|nr:hypothetical protein [Leptolyngbyaceae cyanobacterium RM2_2_21]
MHADEALAVLDQLLSHYPLSNLQEIVFSQVWEGKTYAEIADGCGYEHSYIRDVGFRLWQTLSKALGQKISKSNIRAVVRRYARSHPNIGPLTQGLDLATAAVALELEFPDGPVPLHSKFYIERPPIEAQTLASVVKPGSLIRLKAPCQMGKTSLLRRLLAHAQSQKITSVTLSFHRTDRSIYASLDRFLRWFCANISYQLRIAANLDTYWNLDIGSKISCTAYLEDYVLNQIDGGVVIALDEVNELFQYPEISSEFLPLLRSWYEDGREFATWQRIRWVLAHSTDVYVPLQLNQSPFNVGLAVKLPPFSFEQVQELARRHSLTWAEGERGRAKLLPLLSMISYRPSLVRLALYFLARADISLEQLIEEAPTQSGLYSSHLRELLAALSPYRDLQVAFGNVIRASESVELEPITAYRLESLGID